MVMLCMMPMLGRLSATCRLYFEAPELAGIIICVSVRYSRDTCARPQCVSAELALSRWPLGVVDLDTHTCEVMFTARCTREGYGGRVQGHLGRDFGTG